MAITEIELAEKVKSKYPQYKDIDDTELVSLVLDRYPEYSTQLGEKEYSKNLLTNSAKTLVSGGVQAAINSGAGMTQSYSMLLGDKSDTSEEAVEDYASQRRVQQRKGGSRMAKGKILAHRKRKNEVIQSLNENSHRLRTLANSTDERFNIDPEFANSFGGQVLKGFGQMIGNIGAAVVGTAVAGPVGGVAASVGTIAPQMVSEAVSDSEATLGKSYMDMTEEEKDQVALATAGYATLGTALEFAPVARIPWVKNFLRGKTKVPAGLLKSPGIRREIAKGFAAEGFTEAAQGQLLDSLARATFDDDRELMSWDVLRQRFNEFAVGGVVGGGTSGGIATVQKAARGELFKPKETKEVQTDGTKKEVFEITYTDKNTGNEVKGIEIDAENQEEAIKIAGERLSELAFEGTIVARPKPPPTGGAADDEVVTQPEPGVTVEDETTEVVDAEPVTEEVVAEEVIPEAEQAELQEELQEEVSEPEPAPTPQPEPAPEPAPRPSTAQLMEESDLAHKIYKQKGGEYGRIGGYMNRGPERATNDKLFKESLEEARTLLRNEPTPTPTPTPQPEPVQEVDSEAVKEQQNTIDDADYNIANLQSEIEIEKSNIKEARAKNKQEIAAVRKSKLSKEEKTEKIEDLKASLQDEVDDMNGNIGIYKEEMSGFKKDLRKAKKKLAGLQPEVTAGAAPVGTPQFVEDIPAENWLRGKIEDVIDRGTNRAGNPRLGSVTGFFDNNKPLRLELDTTKNVEGLNGEHLRLDQGKVDKLADELLADGKFKTVPLIGIAYNGKPYIVEGNHRIAASQKAGIPIEVEIKYYDGGQRNAQNGFKPDELKSKLAGLQPEVTAGAAAVGLTPKEFTSRLKDTKVVDDQDKPIKVYRGTRNIEFETEGRGRVPSFTSSPDVASTYSSTIGGGPFNMRLSFEEGASVSPVFLSMKKPLDFTAEDNLMSLGNYLAYMEYGNDKNGITKEEVDKLINYMVRRGRGKTKAKGDFVFRLDDSFVDPRFDLSKDEYADLIDFKYEYDSGFSLEDNIIQDGLYFDQFIAADAPVTKRVAERLGFDGIIHKDAFGLKEEYEQLTGKKVEGLTQEKREDGLSIIEDDIHITYRPFSEEQVIGSYAAPVEPEITSDEVLTDEQVQEGVESEHGATVEGDIDGDVFAGAAPVAAPSQQAAPIITRASLAGKKLFAYFSDRTRVGTYTGINPDSGISIDLQGGPMYPFMGNNKEKKAGWAFSSEGMFTRFLNRVKKTDGIGLVTLYSKENLRANLTFLKAYVAEVKYAIEQGTITEQRFLEVANNLRESAVQSKKKTGKSLDKPFESIEDFEKGLADSTFDVRAAAFFGYNKNKKGDNKGSKIGADALVDEGFPNISTMVDLFADPSLDGLEAGTIVSAVQFDQNQDGPSTATTLGVDEHLSYKVVIKGEGLGFFSDPVLVSDVIPSRGRTRRNITRSAETSMADVEFQADEVAAQAASTKPGDTTEIRSVVRDAMKIRTIQRYFTETLVEDGVYETGSLEEINEKVSDFALLKEAEYLLDFAETSSEKGKIQSLIDTLKAIRAEDTRPRTTLDEQIEAFAPFGKSITSREELRDFVFSFSPIAEKLGFKINPKRSGHEARFSSNNNAVEIVFPKLYRRISEALDLQGGGRRTGTGFVTAMMREEIVHGTVYQVLRKKGIEDTQAWYEQLGRDLTQAQRNEVNDVYNIEEGYKGVEDFGYGTEFARMIIQRGLYGNVTEAFTSLNKGTAYDKMVRLLKSVQAYITKALKGEVTTNPEAAGVIMEAARLLQSVDPEAKLVNQKVVNDSLAFSVDVNPNAEVTSEQVAESGKPPSEKKLNINFARKYLLTVSSLLNSIHPRLKKLIRDYYGAIQGEVLDYQKRVAPFFKKYRGIKNVEDRKRLKQLLSYSPVEQEGVDPLIAERDALLRKYDLFNDYQLEIRPVLNELYNRLGNEGIMIGFLEQYFPRSIKDLDKVKNRAGKELRDAFREFIKTRNKRIEDARKRIDEGNPRPGDVELSKETTIQIGNEKTAALEAQQWDQFTRGFNSEGRRNLPGNFLSRTEELNVIPENLLDAYEDPGAAMERYIYNAVSAIQTTKLMGSKFANVPEGLKVPPASELGLLIQELRANGEISMEDADGTVPDIFAMILSPMQVENMFFQLARTFGYGTLLVEFTSTLSQLYDLPFIMLDNGIFGTAVAMFGPRLKGDDFGIDTQQVSAEFASDNRVLEKAVRLGLRATGFTKLDQVMKETNLTANYNRYRKLARGYFKDRNSANSKKFVAELTSMGYSEQEQTQIIADLKKGDRDSAYIRTLLFNKLSETQPLTKAEMALGIVGNPNLRFTVAMKSFMIKQLNFVRDRMVNEFIDGVRTGDARKIRKASNDIALLMTFMLLIGLPVDALKDFLAGRLGYMSDYLFNGVFRIAGVSRYTAYQARKEGVGQAAFDYVTPVAIQQFVDMTSEVGRVARGERAITESKFVTLLPFSDVINRIFGFQQGRERKEYMRRVREGERPFIVPPGAL